jgi:hypothetical protein
VGQVAHTVEVKAEGVEEAVRPEGQEEQEGQAEATREGLDKAAQQVQDGLKDIGKDTTEKWNKMETDAPDRLKTSIADSVQKVINVLSFNLPPRFNDMSLGAY